MEHLLFPRQTEELEASSGFPLQIRHGVFVTHLQPGRRDQPPEAAVASSSKGDVSLPEGLLLYSRLESAIEFGQTAVGDRFSVVLDAQVKSKGVVQLPKGARLTGRVLQMERRQASTDYFAVVLELTEAETESVRGRIRARLVEAGNPARGNATVAKPGEPVRIGRIVVDTGARPAERAAGSLFYVIDSRLKLPRGFRMVWQTGPQE